MIEQVHMDVISGIARTLGFKPRDVTGINITPYEVVVTSFGEPKILPGGKPNLIEHRITVVRDA